MLKRPVLVVVTALALVAPVVGLGAYVHDTIASDVAARSTGDRVQAGILASRLIGDDLVQAGELATYLAARPEIKSALQANDAAALARELASVGAVWTDYAAVVGLDAHGMELAVGLPGSTRGIVTGTDRSTRDYFTGAIATDKPFVSEAYRSAAPDQATLVAVSAAVRDSRLLGVIAVTIAPKPLIEEVQQADGIAGREILIVDKRSHVVTSTTGAHAPLSDAQLPSLDAALAGSRGSSRVSLADGDRIVTYVPIPGAAWALYVIDDPAVVLSVERSLQDRISVAASAALLATLMLAGGLILLYAVLARRTDELTRSREALVASNAQLAEANRHKTEFLSSVSHELRTPMNAILGFTDLLDEQLRPTITERQHHYFRNIREAGDHLLQLIDDVLDLSRVETGRIELRREVLTIEQLMEPVLANARRSAAERSIAFTASCSEAAVRLDAGRVRQVLYNLSSNALKFTPAGGQVSCRTRLDGDALVVEVSDNGIGIPLDRQARVFGMFERVNEDRSDAKGTGLGLALSKRIVELHGGSIGFQSTADHGSTFWVRLPGVVEPVAAPRAPEEDHARIAG
jgi:signal transduction histidine kinase